MDNLQTYMDTAVNLAMTYLPKAILAIVVLLVGFWVIKLVVKGLGRGLSKSNVELSLQKFLTSFVSVLLKILLLISVASMIGVATTSFVAIIGAAGLAVGLALQGSLGNFAGGILILLFKPFKVGDVIDGQGQLGIVNEIQIFNTILKTFDNKTVIIPNGALSNGNIVNYSTEPTRRVDMTFGIGYGDDIQKAKDILNELINSDARVMQSPEPQIVVSELGESSVNIVVRVWCEAANYWGIYFEMQEKVKQSFDKNGISIPFPQRDIHMYQSK